MRGIDTLGRLDADAGLLRLRAGQRDGWGAAPRPRWPLGELSAPPYR